MPNRLADETSPYLLQHAHDPVDWYPWGDEALERAKAEGKPILLSIGYSACHWCHVMARESFRDEAIAAFLDEHFVSVKVDREERPDLDEVYMRAVQGFQQGRGGWPMTVFLTPDGVPFFGGTYYPPTARDGLPSFLDVLTHMVALWRGDEGRIREVTRQIRNLLAATSDLPDADPAVASWLDPVARQARATFDDVNGGFGGAPRFPPHGVLAVLLAHGQLAEDERSLDMALTTLDRIAQGGLYDLVGGGFARYSVDTAWRIPRFEKMLYDTAQLVSLYVDAWRITRADRFEQVVRHSLRWLLDEMQLDDGAFASSVAADSEGGEGRFVTWTPDQLERIFGPDDAERLCELLGVTDAGTFEEGTSVLRLERPIHRLDLRERALIERALPRLRRVRRLREPPARDDKVVTAWNGLAISALARASAAFGEPTWAAAASVAARFLLDELIVDGRLMRTHRDGRAHVPAYADDHAALALGLLDLYQATFDEQWLGHAEALADRLVERFWDPAGGLFYTGSDQPELVVRSKHALGGAEPSANGLAALLFARLDLLCGRSDLGERADTILHRLAPYLERAPMGLGPEALAGALRAGPALQIALVGEPRASADLWHEVRTRFLPMAVIAARSPGATSRVPFLEGKDIDAPSAAFVCRGPVCDAPATERAVLRDQLDRATRPVPLGVLPVERREPGPLVPDHEAAWLPTVPPLAGRVWVLCFVAPSRVDSQAALEALQATADALVGEAVAVFAVCSPKFHGLRSRGAADGERLRLDLTVPFLVDTDESVAEAFDIDEWPTWVLVDAEGRLAARHEGVLDAGAVLPAVRALLPAEVPEGAGFELPPPVALDTRLRGPRRVHVFPDAIMQEMGADALSGGVLYVSDTGNHRVLELEVRLGDDGWPAASLVRAFGTGTAGYVDGPSEVASFRRPMGLSRSTRELFVADQGNHAVRVIDLPSGAVRTLAGTGQRGMGRPRGDLRLEEPLAQPLRDPVDVEVLETKAGTLCFIAVAGSHQIWAAGAGHLGLFAGSGLEDHVDGPAAIATLAQPTSLALFGRYLLFVDSQTSSIRGVDLQHHQAVTVVGKGLHDFGHVDGFGDAVRLQHPEDLTFVGESLYVADHLNGMIRRIDLATLRTTTIAGADGAVGRPTGIDRLGAYLVVADPAGHRLLAVQHATGAVRELVVEGI